MSSPILRGVDLRIDRDGSDIAEVVRLVLNPIWNAYHFFTLYANADGYRRDVPHRRRPALLDRYILAKTRDAGRAGHRAHRHLRHRRRLRRGAGVPRRAQQLVHPPLPGSLLGAGSDADDDRGRQGRRLRHALHGARPR